MIVERISVEKVHSWWCVSTDKLARCSELGPRVRSPAFHGAFLFHHRRPSVIYSFGPARPHDQGSIPAVVRQLACYTSPPLRHRGWQTGFGTQRGDVKFGRRFTRSVKRFRKVGRSSWGLYSFGQHDPSRDVKTVFALQMVCYTFLGPSRRVLHLQRGRQGGCYTRNVKEGVTDETSTRNVNTKRQHETYRQNVNTKRIDKTSTRNVKSTSKRGFSSICIENKGNLY
jgi:hypothetical protein